VCPAYSPEHPPPVENPALVPDFTQAWTEAYTRAKAKVGGPISLKGAVNIAVVGVGEGGGYRVCGRKKIP